MKLSSPLVVVFVALLSLVFVEKTAHGFYLPGVAPQGAFCALFFSLSLSFKEEIPTKATLYLCGRPGEIALFSRSRLYFSRAFLLTP
jgi:hypothetical protein